METQTSSQLAERLDQEPEPEAAVTLATSPALQALHDLDPDALSPREALEALYRLKALSQHA